jgi:hypothetical protein
VAKISSCINKNPILGRVLKMEAMVSFPLYFSQQYMLVELVYVFCVDLLDLEFSTLVFDVKMISSSKNFMDKYLDKQSFLNP